MDWTNPSASRKTSTFPTLRRAIVKTVSFRGLQSLHRIDDQPFGGLDLFHDEANIHRGVLGLALASAIETVLPDEGKCIRQDVQRRGKTTADRSHLEFIPLFGFTIVIEQSQSPSVDIR